MSATPHLRNARRVGHRAMLAVTALATAACSPSVDRVTSPATPQAAEIDGLWTLILWMGSAVWVVVMLLLAVPVARSWRRRPTVDGRRAPATASRRVAGDGGLAPPGAVLDEPLATADRRDVAAAQDDRRVRGRLLWIGGIVGPALILLVLLVASGRVGASTAHVERVDEVVVEVTGHMFWWEVHYPEFDVTTANEIHVPVDRPVRLRLLSEDVIHSFWVPRIHGKVDTIPGQENWLSFEPAETGRFRGACAEFCGIAHAQMLTWLVVDSPADFADWVERQRAPASAAEAPSEREGQRIFLDAGCASCHAVRGTGATGGVGPDLTHLASRETLAAGIVPNDPAHLAELVVAPMEVKPGIRMPPTELEPDELDALVDYLEGLR